MLGKLDLPTVSWATTSSHVAHTVTRVSKGGGWVSQPLCLQQLQGPSYCKAKHKLSWSKSKRLLSNLSCTRQEQMDTIIPAYLCVRVYIINQYVLWLSGSRGGVQRGWWGLPVTWHTTWLTELYLIPLQHRSKEINTESYVSLIPKWSSKKVIMS